MLRIIRALEGFKLGARDGLTGRVRDFYFDDQSWAVRHLVVETGAGRTRTKMLISPQAVKSIHFAPDGIIEVDLTKEQIEHSPSIDTDKPVSRQFDTQPPQYHSSRYRERARVWGLVYSPDFPAEESEQSAPSTAQPPRNMDTHLRSANEVYGYSIQAHDHHFGHVEDFVVDDETWQLRYVVVDTRNWWPGKKVLLALPWVSRVSWPRSRVYVEMEEEAIKHAPEYDEAVPLTRDYEASLFAHYHREPYWARAAATTRTP